MTWGELAYCDYAQCPLTLADQPILIPPDCAAPSTLVIAAVTDDNPGSTLVLSFEDEPSQSVMPVGSLPLLNPRVEALAAVIALKVAGRVLVSS